MSGHVKRPPTEAASYTGVIDDSAIALKTKIVAMRLAIVQANIERVCRSSMVRPLRINVLFVLSLNRSRARVCIRLLTGPDFCKTGHCEVKKGH
jgi:hypothetical protein